MSLQCIPCNDTEEEKDKLHDRFFLTANARVNPNSLFINALDVDNVDISFEEGLDGTATGVFPDWDPAKDSSDFNAVTGLGNVNEVVKDTH